MNQIKQDPDVLKRRMDNIPDHLLVKCLYCHNVSFREDIGPEHVCPKCGFAFRILAKRRVKLTFDDFEEMDADLTIPDRYTNKKYREKIAKAEKLTGLKESVLTGKAKIKDLSFYTGIMDPYFIMGSLGSATGEKIARMFNKATAAKLPVVMFTASGGARMQEGIDSLMQMAKISSAVAKHDQTGLLYIVVLCDPTTGGVTASFAMQGDIILAEKHALVGFAGRRVIEQTIHQKLPANFQRAETVEEHGFIDAIIARKDVKPTLYKLIKLHQKEF